MTADRLLSVDDSRLASPFGNSRRAIPRRCLQSRLKHRHARTARRSGCSAHGGRWSVTGGLRLRRLGAGPGRLQQRASLRGLTARAGRRARRTRSRGACTKVVRHEHAGKPLRHRSRRPGGRRHERRRRTDLRALAAAGARLHRARARVPRYAEALDRQRTARARRRSRARCGRRPRGRDRGLGGHLERLPAPRGGLLTGPAATLNRAIDGTPRGPARRQLRSALHRPAPHRDGAVDGREPAFADRLRHRACSGDARAPARRRGARRDHAARIRDRARTRSSRTPSAICSAASTCRGAGRACSAPPPAWPPREEVFHTLDTAALRPRKHRGRSAHRAGRC